MGVATDSMTASAAAPRYVVVTWIIVGLTGGYSAMGSRLRETAPTMHVRMAMTIATMGRRMKKSAIVLIPWRAWLQRERLVWRPPQLFERRSWVSPLRLRELFAAPRRRCVRRTSALRESS